MKLTPVSWETNQRILKQITSWNSSYVKHSYVEHMFNRSNGDTKLIWIVINTVTVQKEKKNPPPKRYLNIIVN